MFVGPLPQRKPARPVPIQRPHIHPPRRVNRQARIGRPRHRRLRLISTPTAAATPSSTAPPPATISSDPSRLPNQTPATAWAVGSSNILHHRIAVCHRQRGFLLPLARQWDPAGTAFAFSASMHGGNGGQSGRPSRLLDHYRCWLFFDRCNHRHFCFHPIPFPRLLRHCHAGLFKIRRQRRTLFRVQHLRQMVQHIFRGRPRSPLDLRRLAPATCSSAASMSVTADTGCRCGTSRGSVFLHRTQFIQNRRPQRIFRSLNSHVLETYWSGAGPWRPAQLPCAGQRQIRPQKFLCRLSLPRMYHGRLGTTPVNKNTFGEIKNLGRRCR